MSQWKGYMYLAGITCTPFPPILSFTSKPSAISPGPVMCSATGFSLSVLFLHSKGEMGGQPLCPDCA